MSDISRELRKVADERLIGVANTRVSDLADRIRTLAKREDER